MYKRKPKSKVHVTIGSCNFMGGSPSPWLHVLVLSICISICGIVLSNCVISLNLPCDLTRSRDLKVMWLYGYDPVKVSQHPAKFGGYLHCGIGVIMVLLCHLISQDTSSKDHVTLWMGAPNGKSLNYNIRRQ